MQTTLTAPAKRIESIDILRGLVMVIMALDHVRDYFHSTAFTDDPLNLATTTPSLFFTRFVTHYCAPVFVFLSGTSIYLQSLRKTTKELSNFLLKRGLWLIFIEIFVNTLFWTFNPLYSFINMQVLWAIGVSMIILAIFIRLPFRVILITGLLIVLFHNLLDIPESAKDFKPGIAWKIFHSGGGFMYAPNQYIDFFYPFVPWTGLMMLGYCMGIFYTGKYTVPSRRKILAWLGIGLILLFVVLRFTNEYGDPRDWSEQRTGLFTVLSFMNVQKYPPSLLFMCITIGPGLLFLAFIEPIKNRITGFFRTFGRTAFFYYILHVLLIHILVGINFFAKGHTMKEAMELMQNIPFLFIIPGEGYRLLIVYLIWFAVVLMLYPICRWYDKYKTTHKEKKWLSYL